MTPIRPKRLLALSTVLIFALSAGAADAPSDTRAIQTVFSQYKAALLEGDGSKAADIVSARTIAFYDGIAAHALKTPRAKLADLDFISKFMVLRIRLEFTRSQIEQMTGRELLATGVEKGWISKSTVANIERLVNVKVVASEASASLPVAPEIAAFRFLRESGKWKLDLVATFALANAAMMQEVTKSGMTEDQFILRVLSALSSKEVNERIFSPPRE